MFCVTVTVADPLCARVKLSPGTMPLIVLEPLVIVRLSSENDGVPPPPARSEAEAGGRRVVAEPGERAAPEAGDRSRHRSSRRVSTR